MPGSVPGIHVLATGKNVVADRDTGERSDARPSDGYAGHDDCEDVSMSTDCLFREDSYLKGCEARVVAINPDGGVVLERTVFYAASGGQPADRGTLVTPSGEPIAVTNVVFTDPGKSVIAHVPAPGGPVLSVGETVQAAIDWPVRHARMRMHTALHLLSAVLPYPVTGGSVGEAESRLDFDIPEAGLDKDAITRKLAEMIAADAPVTSRWITDEELAANPSLVKTMSVKPPVGTGRVRLIEIAGLDLQPCGGTHVRSTAEIGAVRVTQIEKKGKMNRRVRLALV
jgi:misacylated tRNA(Ala) deacylase